MKYIFYIAVCSCLLFSFCNNQSKNKSKFIIAFVQDKYKDKLSEVENGMDNTDSLAGDGSSVMNFIGIFPESNDTIIIYKLKEDLKEKPEKFSFWSKKSNKELITFFSSEGDLVKVTFAKQNTIIVNNDIYTVNNQYYVFLKQKIFNEKSILDLAFFLKDGYGDYSQTLETLNKNWRNQKENPTHRIIKAKIKNKNYQTDNQFFNYNFIYNYNENGILENILGENSFNKKFVKENNKYIIYNVDRSINERALDNEYLYKNKKTLFDSVIGTREIFSNATMYNYVKYQSKLKFSISDQKPKNVDEILEILVLNQKDLH
ncbi:hypothetical protein SGQ44_17840 [Flavobacterium sp. Fl-77]|uniref:Uncharacterized protein n=1 Tax=Flavobacterium flavipigmentatum TaxID=2893884 RepID=A0AAJ2SAF6_9FLAO|nr:MULTISPECIES: hypothetical protein [unclassified Flavobacterium]MDX6183225.1 hypothetical protein [Flavobacterium sp. Fl-33]MDX6187623.1 hypothetical protein [Flavobacterium sp. Fl-77]UFH40362.1 hypothetical protein LNP22_08810 [Flavobacterium sp. F-70]